MSRPVTSAEGEEIWMRTEIRRQEREKHMPSEESAIQALFEAWQRLKELGWREPMYCPKDGSTFKVIELGSTGIFDCYYHGDWPDGCYMVMDEHDAYPTTTGVALHKVLVPQEIVAK